MRITAVRAVHPDSPATPTDWRGSLGQILVTVETDAGVQGIGVGGGGPAAVHVIHAILGPLVTGQEIEDAVSVERLWERMYRATLPYGRKGLAIMAVSGVDLALWDAVARGKGMSVRRLLGGLLGGAPAHTGAERIPCYMTGPDLEGAASRGFTAVKLPTGQLTPAETVARIARARDAVGPDVQLMVDAGARWNLDGSLRAAEGLARSGVRWLEEPLPPDDLEGYATLAARSPVPIAGGEHEYTVHGFRELAAHGAHHVWQPDVCWTGGLTQLRAIYALAAERKVRVVPHRGAEVWALHAIAALDPAPLAESGRPWLTWLHHQPEPAAGWVTVPDRPGFGVRVDATDVTSVTGVTGVTGSMRAP